ncbi:hypothetical protein [Aurantimonas sp. A3-2-R12]|uniref:hypothetical protein n=1 Tax=Aurantimonas sp. A3-2-R12 TaxID=3114362 RepID=UPI002E173BDF|nr:hypothetical protein [Aurantimonas sp. A3-2-R12]
MEHADQRDKAADYQNEGTDQYIRACSDHPDFFLKIACIVQAVDANRQAQRAKYDLEAQQDMAEFAYGGLLVSVFGLFLSFVGVIFIVITLRSALEANQIAREEQRAWIDFEFADELKLRHIQTIVWANSDGSTYEEPWPDQPASIDFKVLARNIGKSVAEDISLKILVLKGEWNYDYSPLGKGLYTRLFDKFAGQGFASHVFPGQPLSLASSIGLDPESISEPIGGHQLLPRIAVYATYRTSGDPTIRETGKIFFMDVGRENFDITFKSGENYDGRAVSHSANESVTYIT